MKIMSTKRKRNTDNNKEFSCRKISCFLILLQAIPCQYKENITLIFRLIFVMSGNKERSLNYHYLCFSVHKFQHKTGRRIVTSYQWSNHCPVPSEVAFRIFIMFLRKQTTKHPLIKQNCLLLSIFYNFQLNVIHFYFIH